MKSFTLPRRIAIFGAALMLFTANDLLAHCDTMDGPIIREAIAALGTGDISPVLKWVREEDEPLVRDTFRRTRAVRGQGDAVRAIADQLFLETLIRVHRQGEGAPYTGLKPAGTAAPAVLAADTALDSGSVGVLAERLGEALDVELRRRFAAAHELRARAGDDVSAGRAYVEAYVAYIHFVEALHALIESGTTQHHLDDVGRHAH